jgi:hypothetical protein
MIILFDKVCIYNKFKNETIIYGHYLNKFENVEMDTEYILVFCENRNDFYIKIVGKPCNIEFINFYYQSDNTIIFKNIQLCFPFENCDLALDKNTSAIITTMCKNYSHRLDEWIQYNLKLGFSGIIIFNNDANRSNGINESTEHCIVETTMNDICNKYRGKVFIVDFPYSPFPNVYWNSIQSISLYIGVNEFVNKCRNIALIDADEFIHLPKMSTMNIEEFLNDYNHTITMRSNILTNKNENDIVNNNVLQISEYIGEDKYTKTILYTNNIKEYEFTANPHEHHSEKVLNKDEIIHYHCWVNQRYKYNEGMTKIHALQSFINNIT